MSKSLEGLPIAKGTDCLVLLASMANRHGLIAGATGTGKTVTLRVLTEQFSRIGVRCSWRTPRAISRGSPEPAPRIPRSASG